MKSSRRLKSVSRSRFLNPRQVILLMLHTSAVAYILCGTSFFGSKRFFLQIPLPLSTFCCIYSWGQRSEQLPLPGWGSCADLVKNRGVLCSWCDLFKNDAILERTSYQKNLQHRVRSKVGPDGWGPRGRRHPRGMGGWAHER